MVMILSMVHRTPCSTPVYTQTTVPSSGPSRGRWIRAWDASVAYTPKSRVPTSPTRPSLLAGRRTRRQRNLPRNSSEAPGPGDKGPGCAIEVAWVSVSRPACNQASSLHMGNGPEGTRRSLGAAQEARVVRAAAHAHSPITVVQRTDTGIVHNATDGHRRYPLCNRSVETMRRLWSSTKTCNSRDKVQLTSRPRRCVRSSSWRGLSSWSPLSRASAPPPALRPGRSWTTGPDTSVQRQRGWCPRAPPLTRRPPRRPCSGR